MTQQPFPQQGFQQPPQQQFPQQGYAPVQQQGGGYGQPAPQQFPQQQAPWGGQPQQAAPQQPAAPAIETGDSFDDFFTGTGEKIPSFDFGATQNGGEKLVGATLIGTITEMAKMQQRDYSDKGKLLFWEPRNEGEQRRPKMQLAITLQTELRGWQGVKPKLIPTDPATEQPLPPDKDTGLRRLYVKEFSDMNRAINIACSAAGQKPRIGGKLAVGVRGFEPSDKGNDKVLYDAQYMPAPEKVATDSFFEQPQQPQAFQPQAPAPQQTFVQQAPTYAPPVQMPAQQGAVQPQVAGYQIQPEQAAPGGQVHAAAPYAGVPAQPNGAPEGFQPQQHPSTLGQGQAPTTPPEWATQPQQGEPAYAAPGTPVGYDKPPF